MNHRVSTAIAEIMRTDIQATPTIEHQHSCDIIRNAVLNAVYDFKNLVHTNTTALNTCPDCINYIFTLSGIYRVISEKNECVVINMASYDSSFSDYNQLATIISSVALEYPELYFRWPYVESPSGISDEELGARIAGMVSIADIPESFDFTKSKYQFGLRLYTGVIGNKSLNSRLQAWLPADFYAEFPDLKTSIKET